MPRSPRVVIVQHFEFTIKALAYLFASAMLHTAYYLCSTGYRHGELSVVYPLARATGPLLTVLVAVALLGERPGILALCVRRSWSGSFFLARAPPSCARRAHRVESRSPWLPLHDRSYTVVDKQRERRADTPILRTGRQSRPCRHGFRSRSGRSGE